jgi:diadenosine tetraphosphate (Ap4A) HIT family hydrolase
MTEIKCALCDDAGGEIIFRNDRLRVIMIDDANYPGFCRVIWNAHVKEMTDLSSTDRYAVMDAVWKVEAAQREVLQPWKINLASLGNMVPHVHWHLIPRYVDDAHFPNPIWAQTSRHTPLDASAARRELLPALRAAVARNLAQ